MYYIKTKVENNSFLYLCDINPKTGIPKTVDNREAARKFKDLAAAGKAHKALQKLASKRRMKLTVVEE